MQCFTLYNEPDPTCAYPTNPTLKRTWWLGAGNVPQGHTLTVTLQRNKTYQGGSPLPPDAPIPYSSLGAYAQQKLACMQGTESGSSSIIDYTYVAQSSSTTFQPTVASSTTAQAVTSEFSPLPAGSACVNVYSQGKYRSAFTTLAGWLVNDRSYPVAANKVAHLFSAVGPPASCLTGPITLHSRKRFDIASPQQCAVSFDTTGPQGQTTGSVLLQKSMSGTRSVQASGTSTTFDFVRGQAPQLLTQGTAGLLDKKLSGEVERATLDDQFLTVYVETLEGTNVCLKYHYLK
jgi:hypothetical protein